MKRTTEKTMEIAPSDERERRQAIRCTDRNLVVVAGAGTGKTTLLIDRILWLLLGPPPQHLPQGEHIQMTQILAMTFTEKAANEMRQRLSEALTDLLAFIAETPQQDEKRSQKARELVEELQSLHPPMRLDDIESRARSALEALDRATIDTIHSFGATILKEYAVEAGVDPAFEVDDGRAFDEMFEREWQAYLEVELGTNSANARTWLDLLGVVELEDIASLAKELASLRIDLDNLTAEGQKTALATFVKENLAPNIPRLQKFLDICKERGRRLNAYREIKNLQEIIQTLSAADFEKPIMLSQEQINDLNGDFKAGKTGWPDENDQQEIKDLGSSLAKLILALSQVNPDLLQKLLSVTVPFARRMRQKFLQAGLVSFDGLLSLTRNLLRDNRAVRNELKKRFAAVLVDEFQDTDPLQYEIVLYLCEKPESFAKDIDMVQLTEGKLFIVGDPKQSIYAFRYADIEAYQRVAARISPENDHLKLTRNFRSHAGILHVVNGVFEKLIEHQEGLQPRYDPIFATRQPTLPLHKVELVVVCPDDEEKKLKASESRLAEGRWIANWISENMASTKLVDAAGIERNLKYSDIAILMRKLTGNLPYYLEALRDADIPYIVEGEKFFYSNQEVIDLANILRAIANPEDKLALLGILRSPLGALPDDEITRLALDDMLDYQENVRTGFPHAQTVNSLFDVLRRLNSLAQRVPVDNLLDEVFKNTYFLQVLGASFHGEQKLANVLKLRAMASEMTAGEPMTLRGFVKALEKKIEEVEQEGESPLADETLDAVKVLSIHKAKGLEFPVVILADLAADTERKKNKKEKTLQVDWSRGKIGLAVGNIRNVESIELSARLAARQREEEKRVLYVAMTRARERLILMTSSETKTESYTALLRDIIKDLTNIDFLKQRFPNNDMPRRRNKMLSPPFQLRFANAILEVRHISPNQLTRRKAKTGKATQLAEINWREFARTWEERENIFATACRNHLFLSPSKLVGEREELSFPPFAKGGAERDFPYAGEPLEADSLERPFRVAQASRPCAEVAEASHLGGKVAQAPHLWENKLVVAPAIVGSICHLVLQYWDFTGDRENLRRLIEQTVPMACAQAVTESELSVLRAQVEEILLEKFFDSNAYGEVAAAKILARELPFAIPWDGGVMEGRIDVVYELSRKRSSDLAVPVQVVVADYKTDEVPVSQLAAYAKERYAVQRDIYLRAVRECARARDATFKLIFLRAGRAVEL